MVCKGGVALIITSSTKKIYPPSLETIRPEFYYEDPYLITVDGPQKICVHLSTDEVNSGELDYYVQFTGKGKEFNLICHNCEENGDILLRRIENLELFSFPFNDALNVIGRPEISIREPDLVLHSRQTAISSNGILHAVASSIHNHFYLLYSHDKELVLKTIELKSGSVIGQISIDPHLIDMTLDIEFKMSKDESLVAIVNILGRHGAVFDLRTGDKIQDLDRNDYHISHYKFAYEFLEVNGRQLLIHATDWNRLDITDLRTGEVLSAREREDLDYFQASILVSPDQKKMVVDGWVWHPIGAMKILDLDETMEDPSYFEDDDKHPIVKVTDYFWDAPVVWINPSTILFYGFGPDDDGIIDAALIYDVIEEKYVSWFPVQNGKFFFDGSLVVLAENGISVWDVDTGERHLLVTDLHPVSYHVNSNILLTSENGVIWLHEIRDS